MHLILWIKINVIQNSVKRKLTLWSSPQKLVWVSKYSWKSTEERRHACDTAWQRNRYLLVFPVGGETVQSLLEGALAVDTKITRTQILWPNNSISRSLSYRHTNTCVNCHIHTVFFAATICNNKNIYQTYTFIKGKLVK